MITLGKRGDLAARRQALAYLMTSAAVNKLFDTSLPVSETARVDTWDRSRGWRKGDGADTAFVELLGSEKLQEETREASRGRSKRAESQRAMEEAEHSRSRASADHAEGADKVKTTRVTRESGARLIARPVLLGLSPSYMSPGVYPP